MPGNPHQCRLNAKRCLKLAQHAKRPEMATDFHRFGRNMDEKDHAEQLVRNCTQDRVERQEVPLRHDMGGASASMRSRRR